MNIVHINTLDHGGGAARIAYNIHTSARDAGHNSIFFVGSSASNEDNIMVADRADLYQGYAKMWFTLAENILPSKVHFRGTATIRKYLKLLGRCKSLIKILKGYEDIEYPSTYRLLSTLPFRPDIIHCHNLHGGYFDLRAIPAWSRDIPLIITLHDEWLFTGHCAYTLSCEKWQYGCMDCDNLNIYPKIYKDKASANWHIKKDIFSNSRLFIASPSSYLYKKANASILATGISDSKVIPYGIDLSRFKPGNKSLARKKLGIKDNVKVFLFSGAQAEKSLFKDATTVINSMAAILKQTNQNVLLIVLGYSKHKKEIVPPSVRFVPFQNDLSTVIDYFHAADVYLHAAKGENFPLTILEAMACGLPVIATDVGGIPDQVVHNETGFLVKPGDSLLMANFAVSLIENDDLYDRVSNNALNNSKKYSLQNQTKAYLTWYKEICSSQSENPAHEDSFLNG